ncbi:O-methyltransferase [Flavimobilis sp. GY10621]|uniref:O-methyltransferase n=1 Tax=Flavimobilis rhizosphaerae TaxID=2775421 RepID=A0ABR9DPX0_9MICO|nr:O-methyltransferase [Flavimobilis rhizosphaerae]MBD9698994.1 O-methyltransferase [Flavimobilis rhizosphaerae]
MSSDKTLAWDYCEDYVVEDDVLLRARERAAQYGCHAIAPGAGAVLRLLAATLRARTAVEVGTGTGVASLWLLRGMDAEGVLTTIDPEAENQRAAKAAFAEDGIRPERARTINGRPRDVLPRLADAAYDLVLVGSDSPSAADHVEQALRLLRPGGVLVVDEALWRGRVADPARRDEATTMVREIGRSLREDPRVLPAMIPSGDGLLLAVRR